MTTTVETPSTNGAAKTGPVFRQPGAAPTTLNVLLYGPPGTGKSTAAAKAPGPMVVLTTQGENAWRTPRALSGKPEDQIREFVVTGTADLDQVYLYLRSQEGGEQTVVLDTIGDILNIVLAEYAGPGGRPTQSNWGDALTKIERFVMTLRDLPINQVVIAHEQLDDKGDEITRRPQTGGQKLPEQVMSHMDVVAYTGVVPATDEQPQRFVGQLVEAAGRRAKDRTAALSAEPVRDLDLSEWISTAAAHWGQPETSEENN